MRNLGNLRSARPRKPLADNFIKFLGTAGARFVMIRQLRASGGLWIRNNGVNILVDPGPGSLVRCTQSRPKLDPATLDAIILTHRHLDHSNDINVMIEAMTEGGFKKRGVVFLPADAQGENGVILRYAGNFPEKIVTLSEKTAYSIGNFEFVTGPRNKHPVETYGFKFIMDGMSVGLVGDTTLYPELYNFYTTDILILNTVFFEPRPTIEHLSFREASRLIDELKPHTAILTHFGMTMLKEKPHIIIGQLKKEMNRDIIAASDGMTFSP